MKILCGGSVVILFFLASCAQVPKQNTIAQNNQQKQDQSYSNSLSTDREKIREINVEPFSEPYEDLKILKPRRSSDDHNTNIVAVDSEGRLVVNEKPFFVIGLYNVPQNKLAEAKELGFNSVHTYRGEGPKDQFRIRGRANEMLAYLQTAHEQGLMVWMGLPRYEVSHDFTSAIERFIDSLKDAPALMSWYLYDEPDCDNVPVSKIEFVAEMLQHQDPYHPKLLVLCEDEKKSQEYFFIPDIMITDLYPLKEQGASISDVTKRIEKVKAILSNNIPVWNVVQLHGKGKGGTGYGLKEPNYEELRNMTYQSIVAGAKGLLFFAYSGKEYNLYDSPQGLVNIKKMTNELRQFIPIFLTSSVKPDFITIEKNQTIRTRIFKFQNKYYLFVVNLSRDSTNIEIKIKRTPNLISEISSARAINLINTGFIEKINSLGVNIYELTYY